MNRNGSSKLNIYSNWVLLREPFFLDHSRVTVIKMMSSDNSDPIRHNNIKNELFRSKVNRTLQT